MQLTSSNLTSNATIFVDTLTTNNITINSQSISISGNQVITTSNVAMGNVSLTTAGLTTPLLFIGGASYGIETTMGIVNAQFFTSNGTWTKPTNANNSDPRNQVLIMAWGGGGGAASNNSITRSGGGGACAIWTLPLSNLPNTVSVTVGEGGTASRTTTSAIVAAGDGGNTSFGGFTVYGGGGGSSGSSGGAGGGTLSAGVTSTSGSPLGGAIASPGGASTYGGGGPSSATGNTGGASIFGGGGGVQGSGNGGVSVYGGGGGGQGVGSVVGTSILGGNGGLNGTAGLAPGGGGSANTGAANTGGRGEVRVWVIGPGPIVSSYQPNLETYSVSPNTTVHFEGNTVTFSISAITSESTLYYTLNNSSTAVATDFTSAVNGSVNIVGGVASFTLTANNTSTIKADRNYFLDLRVGSTTGNIVAKTANVTMTHSVRDVSYRTLVTSNSAIPTYTFDNVDIGVPSIYRYVVFGVVTGGRRIETFTVNGETLTAAIIKGSSPDSAFFVKQMPSGTTANVTMFGGGANYSSGGLSTWALYNIANASPVITKRAGSDTLNITGTILPGDFVFVQGLQNDPTKGDGTITNTGNNIGFVTQFSNVQITPTFIYLGAHAKTGNTIVNPSVVVNGYTTDTTLMVLR